MFNIFSKFIKPDLDDLELTDAEIEAEEKKARIQFHREKVRNGPANFTMPTNGQVKRAKKRELTRSQKKAFRAEVRNYHERSRVAATVRGHLQAAGVIPYARDFTPPLHQQISSTGWLVQRFGVDQGNGTVSYREADIVEAMQKALAYYGPIVGQPHLRLPTGFVPAISLVEDPIV